MEKEDFMTQKTRTNTTVSRPPKIETVKNGSNPPPKGPPKPGLVRQVIRSIAALVDTIYLKLEQRRAMVVIGLVAVVLLLPSLQNGYLVDDLLFHDRYFNQGHTNILEQFTFNSYLEPEQFSADQRNGQLPWWASEELHVSFFRPLSALTHMLDYVIFGSNKVAMQGHNLLWFILVLFSAGFFFRRFYKAPVVAGITFMFFALDDTHGFPVGWLANRNAMIAIFFGIWSLYFLRRSYALAKGAEYDRNYILAGVAALLGLLAGEAGVQTFAWLFAYTVFFGPTGGFKTKVKMLVPFGILATAYLVVLAVGDYGASGSGLYNDPKASPVEYLLYFPLRSLQLLAGQFWFPPAHISQLLPPILPLHLILAGSGLALVAYFIWPFVKNSRTVKFWLLSIVLCLVPLNATLPMDRNLWFIGFGGAAILAEFLVRLFNQLAVGSLPKVKKEIWHRRFLLCFVTVLLSVHTIWAGGILYLTSIYPEKLSRAVRSASASLKDAPQDKNIILLNSPSHLLFGYSLRLLWVSDKTDPAIKPKNPQKDVSLHSWTAGFAQFKMTRLTEDTLYIKASDGFNDYAIDKYFRNERAVYSPGQTHTRGDFTTRVMAVDADGLPTEIEIILHKNADQFVTYEWFNNQFRAVTLPVVGETIEFKTNLRSAVRTIMEPALADLTVTFLKVFQKQETATIQ